MFKVNQIIAIVLLIIILLPGILFAQEEKKSDVWEPFKYFVGSWKGEGEGQSGISKLEGEFKFVLNGKYLEVKGKAVFEPQEKNQKGEVHQDWGLFSYDRIRGKFVLRQFHIEGFVNQYVLDTLSSDGKTFVFLSESIENIPVGWRAKVTFKILNENEFLWIFDLASPEKDFECYSENHLQRKS